MNSDEAGKKINHNVKPHLKSSQMFDRVIKSKIR